MSRIKWALKKAEVTQESGLSNAQMMLTNEDLRPVDPERRQWSWLNYIAFWIADSLNINTWMISSSMIVDGLSWWQSWLCVWIGYFIAGGFVCLTGRIGAVYHISFPVTARASFGIWGSFWPVINRVVMAIIWYGVQSYIGGECVSLMIEAIWPSYRHLHNSLSASAGVDTRGFLSFFLFWLLSLPALWFPVHKVRHLFTVKAIYSPIAAIAFFAWAIARANGIGPIVHQGSSIQGSALAWAFVKGVMSCIGNFAALIMNDPDFSRFARKPKDALWSQLLTIPIGFGITSFIGIIVSSSSSVIFNSDPVWNPLDLLGMFLNGASSGQRFGIFVISTGFALAQLGTNISANSVSAGTDLTALMPRYLTIRRGSYICAIIGLAMCPWNLVVTSNQFTTYLSAYSLFLSAIAGVMICDYYIVRKGYLDIKALYSGRKTDPYYYALGFSWKAYAAYFAGILINIVGFAGAVGCKVPIGAQYIYNINYFTGVLVSGGTYWVLTRIFPVPATSDHWNEVDIDLEVDDYGVAYGQPVGDEEQPGYDRRSMAESLPPDEQKKGVLAATKRV
ncbi:Cytosine/purines, uracil, thiamine, allantoin permease family protein [Penicillium ucsense]|uniref:Cytosine/purines, uracil, thiamine, allantoin permease family protein n=1 Tax=Penicillium ucsense TaxID=2839758 RepID=A0A8J8WET2_9EURO|nr:Cytosine/purines, uracil, thiamine, allantoin permease family protein [Penicillium ucsense]KAF7733542.1 Cytosine/purines, uracil, thiamine, allantoin permease family protein [Penicillium ucsense]